MLPFFNIPITDPISLVLFTLFAVFIALSMNMVLMVKILNCQRRQLDEAIIVRQNTGQLTRISDGLFDMRWLPRGDGVDVYHSHHYSEGYVPGDTIEIPRWRIQAELAKMQTDSARQPNTEPIEGLAIGRMRHEEYQSTGVLTSGDLQPGEVV